MGHTVLGYLQLISAYIGVYKVKRNKLFYRNFDNRTKIKLCQYCVLATFTDVNFGTAVLNIANNIYLSTVKHNVQAEALQ